MFAVLNEPKLLTHIRIVYNTQNTRVVSGLHLHTIIHKASVLSCFYLDLSATRYNLKHIRPYLTFV